MGFFDRLTGRDSKKAEAKPSASGAALPSLIPLGASRRPQSHKYKEPPEVRSPQDLPSRLFMGDLAPDTFEISESGWRVEYRDAAPETGVELRLNRAGSLVLTERWRGIPGGYSSAGHQWSSLLQTRLLGGFPAEWDAGAAFRLARYNLTYAPFRREHTLFGPMPDGFFKTIFFPVPVSKLTTAARIVREADTDSSISTPVSA